jgi:lactoylglutathione lyase
VRWLCQNHHCSRLLPSSFRFAYSLGRLGNLRSFHFAPCLALCTGCRCERRCARPSGNPNRVGKSNIRWFIIDGFRTFHLIGSAPEPERSRPFSTHVALTTRDFEAALARLERHRVTYVNLARQPKDITIRPDGVRQVYFQDPDGHWIEINDANAEP